MNTVTTTSPVSLRVAARHQAAVLFRDVPAAETRIEYSDGGRISAVELARWLEPVFGTVVKLRFRPSMVGPPNTVAWEAMDARADVHGGKLVLHAGISEDGSEVVTWGEVTVDER
jgi:hypothetical protein